jgi:O-antigen ligase
LPALCVGLLAFAHGGYFPEAWGWAAMALGLCAVWGVLLRGSVEVSLWLAWLGIGVAAIFAWAALSLVWTADTTGGVQSVQRDGLYLTLMLAAMTVVRPRSRVAVIAGVTTAIVVVSTYAVCTRLFPDRLGAFTDPQGPGRLYVPVGYWNGAAELAAIGLGVVLCAFAYITSPRLRIALSATLPVLALAVFFTYSRGPLLALAGGVLAVLALERRRVSVLAWLVAQAIVPAALVAAAASMHRLSGAGYGRASAGQGHRLAALLVLACATSALVGWAVSRLETRVRGNRRVRTWCLRAIPVAAVAALAVLAVVASPRGAVHRIERSFHSSGPAARSSARLASVSPDSRLALWSVAWDTARRHPLIGAGAGSFETEWLAHRTRATDTRFAHSVFLEAAAEGGLPGLALTAAVLLGPLVAAFRLRRRAGVCLAAGAYVIFVIHASFDWDWELPAVTAAGLWCAVALLADAEPLRAISRPAVRAAVVAAALVAVALAAVGLAGNRDLARSGQAGQAGDYTTALRAARAAGRWQPWSYLPDQDQGAWYAASGRLPEAAAAYRRAVRTAPSAWSAWFGLAEVTTGREQAVALRRARRLNPESRQIAAFCTDSLANGCGS